MVAEEAITPQRVASERFHYEQMVQLIPLLGVVHLAQLGHAPPAKGLVQVQHRHVRKVRYARDDLEEPEALDRALVKEVVQQ